MKSTNVTSKTKMNLPASFTMKDLQAANPGVKYPTLNARVIQLIKKGELIEKGTVKVGTTRGRASIVYAVPEASDNSNLIRKVKHQGRLVTAKKVDAPTVDVSVEVVPSTDVEVPVITEVDPLPAV